MAIIGISGRMGTRVYEYFKKDYDIVGVDYINFKEAPTYKSLKDIPLPLDVVVDFSSVKAEPELRYALKRGLLTLSGTTGYPDKVIDELKKQGQDLFYWSANYSKGIHLFSRLIELIQKEYDLFDFIEIHAATKKDAPSGTAKMLARDLNIPYDRIQSLRINYAPPIHELIFSSRYEHIIIRHEVIDTLAFLEGFDAKLKEMIGRSKNDKEAL